MASPTNPTRRAVLAAGGGGAGAVLLAACSSSGSPGSGAASRAGATSSAASSSAESATTTTPAGGGGGGTKVAALADVAVGTSMSVTLPGGPGLVTRTATDSVVCFSAICTHQGCTVMPEGAIFKCPCHQSEFDPKTGDVTGGPAPSPLEKVAVKVVRGEIVTA